MERYDVFISYRREGGEYTAKMIRDKLKEKGYRVFFDVESLRSGEFNTKLYSVIDGCKDFLLILSPGSLDRCDNEDDWVRREIEYALKKGKNIVPVLLRGFQFPDQLPESIDPIRYRNGLESNTQFFDAFADKLARSFLKSRPGFRRKWLIPAVLLLAALIGGGIWGVHQLDGVYPRTAAEKNAVSELLYCTSINLTYVDLIADSYQTALNSAKLYLSSGDATQLGVYNDLEKARQTIEQMNLDNAQPTEHLLSALESSPVQVVDVTAMYQQTVEFKAETLADIAYIRHVVLDRIGSIQTASDKLKLLDYKEQYLKETMKANALCANGLLLPIGDDALLSFWWDTLPRLKQIPLTEEGWQRNEEQIKSRINGCADRMQQVINKMYVLAGDHATRRSGDIADIVQANRKTVAAGDLFLAEAEDLRVRIDHALDTGAETKELRAREAWWIINATQEESQYEVNLSTFMPEGDDSAEVLMKKADALIAFHMEKSAAEIMDQLILLCKDNHNFVSAVNAWKTWISCLPVTGMRYGVLVCDWPDETSEKNNPLRLGDVIVAFDGKECYSYEKYVALKDAAKGEFTLTVLRTGAGGALESVDVAMNKDMPPAYMISVCSGLQEIYESDWSQYVKSAVY